MSCKAPGNPKCNPSTWDNYTDACCSDQEKCGINEGDCNSNSECHGSLICKLDSCPTNQEFGERASCCQQPSGSYVMGMILKYSICCLEDIATFFKCSKQTWLVVPHLYFFSLRLWKCTWHKLLPRRKCDWNLKTC